MHAGQVKYLRVCQEVRSDLEQLPNGEYRKDHEPFQDFYATPIHKVTGPYGWPSYVAKASLGLVPVEEDGSASFYAPAGKVLYFQVLDENFNEMQRMRSVVQLQPGERRSCIGCHEDRTLGPAAARPRRLRARAAPAGAAAVGRRSRSPTRRSCSRCWDAQCVRCHDAADKQKIDLTGTLRRRTRARLLPHADRRRLGPLLRLHLGPRAPQGRAAQLRHREEPALEDCSTPATTTCALTPRRDAPGEVLDRPELPALARLSVPAPASGARRRDRHALIARRRDSAAHQRARRDRSRSRPGWRKRS